ncbi:uncharacterized protein LOC110326765 [Mus pahari]|uniref:uncharacterized protein LOC110326765 n=1 Tax=Mus pahari TaxID=10093 RepID=UPI000A30CF41|nr:uncharacterized protein LOC110326765 [Mus pahari]
MDRVRIFLDPERTSRSGAAICRWKHRSPRKGNPRGVLGPASSSAAAPAASRLRARAAPASLRPPPLSAPRPARQPGGPGRAPSALASQGPPPGPLGARAPPSSLPRSPSSASSKPRAPSTASLAAGPRISASSLLGPGCPGPSPAAGIARRLRHIPLLSPEEASWADRFINFCGRGGSVTGVRPQGCSGEAPWLPSAPALPGQEGFVSRPPAPPETMMPRAWRAHLVLHRGLRAPGGLVRANPGRRFGPRTAGAGQDPAFLGVVSVRVNGGKRQFSGPRIVAGGGGGGRRDCSFST